MDSPGIGLLVWILALVLAWTIGWAALALHWAVKRDRTATRRASIWPAHIAAALLLLAGLLACYLTVLVLWPARRVRHHAARPNRTPQTRKDMSHT